MNFDRVIRASSCRLIIDGTQAGKAFRKNFTSRVKYLRMAYSSGSSSYNIASEGNTVPRRFLFMRTKSCTSSCTAVAAHEPRNLPASSEPRDSGRTRR